MLLPYSTVYQSTLRYKALKGIPIKAAGMSRGEIGADCTDHVRDAFYQKGCVVRLQFAKQTFVIALDNFEYTSDEEAFEEAVSRARAIEDEEIRIDDQTVKVRLGRLISYKIVKDTPTNREFFGVNGPVDPPIKVRRGWRNITDADN